MPSIFKQHEAPSGCDFLDVTECGSRLTFEAYEEWAGDTETGFGGGGAVTLTRDQVSKLVAALQRWLSAAPATQEQEG